MKKLFLTSHTWRAALSGVLLLTLAAIVATVLAPATQADAATVAPTTARDLFGTWVYVGEPGKVGEAPAKGGFMKHRTEHHWVAVNVDGRSSLVTSTHGGTFRINGNTYEETVSYGGDYQANLMGKTYHWTVTLEGDTMTMMGTDNPWHEVWKRVK